MSKTRETTAQIGKVVGYAAGGSMGLFGGILVAGVEGVKDLMDGKSPSEAFEKGLETIDGCAEAAAQWGGNAGEAVGYRAGPEAVVAATKLGIDKHRGNDLDIEGATNLGRTAGKVVDSIER